jgi:hypothetical protein
VHSKWVRVLVIPSGVTALSAAVNYGQKAQLYEHVQADRLEVPLADTCSWHYLMKLKDNAAFTVLKLSDVHIG